MKFLELGLPEKICHVLEQSGIQEPTAVQAEAIPAALAGRDLISSARTGSGKTLAFSLPVITRLAQDKNATALVLVPTREIGVQVQTVVQPFLKALGLQPATLIIGGVAFGPQIRNLKARPQMIIATPGRLNDHIKSSNGRFRLDHVTALVLDEADRMLDMGFLPQVRQIVQHLGAERQTLLFSATMPPDLARACKEMLRDPQRIAVDAPNTANTDIEQKMVEVETDGKQDALLEAVGTQNESVLVFARTKRRTDRVAEFLEKYDVSAERIHGDRSQAQRQKAIDNFRSGKVKVLVATDIAARGLDIPLVELVINFDLPEAKEDYVHRIGRTGRAGAQGVALSFVTPEERGHWASISGQRREGGKGARGGSRPTKSSRPFGRGERFERPAREERPQREERFARPAREESAPRSEGFQRPERSERPERSFRRDREERFEKKFDRPRREERAPRRDDRDEGGGWSSTPARPSRFKRWGAPRNAEQGASRPANPKHIFTGREGDSSGDRRESRFSRDPRDERSSGSRSFGSERRGKSFGGHGRSAPAMEGGKPRGRWSKRTNREQPEGGKRW